MAQTTSVELKGDRVVAKQLADSQVRRLLEIFRRNNSFQDLKTNTHKAFFIDSSGQRIGEISMQTNHGIENVVVVGYSGGVIPQEDKFKKRQETKGDRLVPCFVVTGEGVGSEQVLGYIVCLSGSFLPPYEWVAIPDDDTGVVLEAFYPEGFSEYDEDVAFRHMRFLGTDLSRDKELYFFRASGIAPDPTRATDGEDYDEGPGYEEVCGEVEFYDGEDSDWVWSTAMSHNPVAGWSASGYSQLLDGTSLFPKYELLVTYDGEYFVQRGRFSCGALDEDDPPPDSCFTGRTEWKATEVFPEPCPSSNGNTVAFDLIQTGNTSADTFLEDDPNGSVRLNETVSDGAYMVSTWTNYAIYHTWRDDLPIPSPYSNVTSNSPCSGCFNNDITTYSSLLVVVDQVEYNVTARFDLPAYSEYRSIGYGNNLVYHKRELPNVVVRGRALAVAKSGPYVTPGMVYDTALYVYVGNPHPHLEGTVSFPLIDNDHSIVPDVINVPDNVICRVRGHVFFGILRTEGEEKRKIAE